MFFTMLQSMFFTMWYFFVSIEAIAAIIITGCCLVLSAMNAVFLYAMVDRQKKDRFFKFDTRFKWLKPNTLYIPFEFRLMLCNNYIVRLSVFGRGFEFQIQWIDVSDDTLSEHKGQNVQNTQNTLPKKQGKGTKSGKSKKSDVEKVLLNSILPPKQKRKKPQNLKTESKTEKNIKLKKISELPMDLLTQSARDLSNISTLTTKTQLRKQHSEEYK